MNVTVFCRLQDETLQLDSEVARRDWAVERHKWVLPGEVLAAPGNYDKYVTLNVAKSVSLGYL